MTTRPPRLSRRAVLAGTAAFAVPPLIRSARAQPIAQTLRVVQPWEFTSLQPGDSGFAYTRGGIIETLLAVEPSGRIVPAIADAWSVSDTARLWRLHIRNGVRFHDGTPCSAQAVKASFERLLPNSIYLNSAGIAGIDAEDEHVLFRLRNPFGPFLAYLVDNSAPVLGPASFDAEGKVIALIGTGPYKVTRLALPRSIELERFSGYWGEPASVPAVRYDAATNGETRANIAIAADAELVLNVSAPSIARIQAAGAMKIERSVIPRVHTLMLNCGKPQFSDRRVRQALSMALDRQGIATGIMRNAALAATQYLPPILPEWHFGDLEPHRLDVAAANALLDQAGWVRGGDGTRVKDGVRFGGSIRTFANRPELPVIATAMQAQFRQVGFELAIQVGEFSAISEAQRDGTLDLGLTSRNLTIVPDPIATILLDFASDTISPGASGTTNWRHDGLRSLVARYRSEVDDERKAGLRRQIAAIIHTELPLIPVVWYEQIVAASRKISGFTLDPFEQRLMLDRVGLS